jgi:hypothetical protein
MTTQTFIPVKSPEEIVTNCFVAGDLLRKPLGSPALLEPLASIRLIGRHIWARSQGIVLFAYVNFK